MEIRPLKIADAFEITPRQFPDDRGRFLESFRGDLLAEAIGHRPDIVQTNVSVSSRGTVRGIHFADVPPSQAKYITALSGALVDYVVDIRVGSPTYGQWEAVQLDDITRRAVYLSEGLGHAFMALEDNSVVAYLCSAPYAPEREHAVNPLDPALGIEWPRVDRAGKALEPLLSPAVAGGFVVERHRQVDPWPLSRALVAHLAGRGVRFVEGVAVTAVDAETVTVTLDATCDGEKVLGAARVVLAGGPA